MADRLLRLGRLRPVARMRVSRSDLAPWRRGYASLIRCRPELPEFIQRAQSAPNINPIDMVLEMTSLQQCSLKLSRRALAALVAATLLTACGGGGGGDHAHTDTVIDTAGRLALAENGVPAVHVYDLDGMSVAATYATGGAPSALYTSPEGRYVVVMQRLEDKVQFIDGGIWQEDHGDHLHDYKQAPASVGWTLTGSRPTHYDLQAGKQAAIFMDGNSASTPVQNAGVRLITDAAIAAGRVDASLDLAFPIHGLGEPVGNKLLTVFRADDATSTLPTHLDLYQRSGSSYTYDRRLGTRCEGMHGSFSSGSHTAVGCNDGVMVVTHTSDTAVTDRLVSTPLRVGTIAGHPRLAGQFIGIATEGTTAAPPVTTRFFAIDAAAGTSAALTLPGWEDGRLRRGHAFDRTGTRFAVLDDQGALRMMSRQGDAWVAGPIVPGLIPAMPAAAPWPVIVANGAKDVFHVTDPVARQLISIDSRTGDVLGRAALGIAPSLMTWTGITR